MTATNLVWRAGRMTLSPGVRVFARLRDYGVDRIPLHGGVVVAVNHFSWLDPPAFGTSCPRVILYVAKLEAIRAPGLGQLLRGFGAFPVRRGEGDREAVRTMRRIAREGHVLGVFAEGTRQRSGVPGQVQAGAAMVAISEGVPVVPGAVHGSQTWRFGNFHPVSIAWGEPMRFDGLPRSGRGYKEASVEIQRSIHRLWHWLVELHELGRPRVATPPR